MRVDPGFLLSLLIIPLVIGHFWILWIALRERQWVWSLAILLLPVCQFAYSALPAKRSKVAIPLAVLLLTIAVSALIVILCIIFQIPINATDLRMFLGAAVAMLLFPMPFGVA
jgi:hypothetical protein